MNTDKLQKKFDDMQKQHEENMKSMMFEHNILKMMPSVFDVTDGPSISNINKEPKDRINAWVSFSNFRKPSIAVAIADALEYDGWVLQPMSLAKYGPWRPSCRVGLCDEQPEEYGREKLDWVDPVLPVYIKLNQHTEDDICFFMAKDGLICKFSIDDSTPYRMTAKKCGIMDEWFYEQGSAKLIYDSRKQTLFHNDQPFASMFRSFACIPTRQGLDGRITFQLDEDDQSEFNMSLVDIIKAIKA